MNPLAVFPWIFRIRLLPISVMIYWAIDIGVQALLVNWVLYMKAKFGFGVVGTALCMLEYGVISAGAQTVGVKLLVPRVGDLRLVIFAVFLKFCAYIMFLASNEKTPWSPFVAVVFFGLASMSVPSILAIISRTTDESLQGKVIASAEMGRVLCDSISNFGFAALFAFFISDTTPTYFPDVVVWSGMVMYAVALTLCCCLFVGYFDVIEQMKSKEVERKNEVELSELLEEKKI